MARLRTCIESDAKVKEEAERLKKDMLAELVNSYEGERVERVKQLMEQKMQEMVVALGTNVHSWRFAMLMRARKETLK